MNVRIYKTDGRPERRQWRYRTDWRGWKQVLSLGLGINPLAPAVRIWIFGWQLWCGRIPVVQWHAFEISIEAEEGVKQ